MAKTKPIGVRFDEELLNKVKEAGIAKSPQKALNLYEGAYLKSIEEKVVENNKPENKAKIEAERNPEIPVKPMGYGHPVADVIEMDEWRGVIGKRIDEYQKELSTVPDVGAGKQRRRWLQNKIYELKQQLK